MKLKWIVTGIFLYSVALYSSVFVYSLQQKTEVVEDAGKLLPTKMKVIRSSHSIPDLQKWIQEEETISIAGMQHSQGGHTLYPNGTLLDMKSYNKILDFDPGKRKITVQSGATWADIQEKINPFGLSIKVMQSQNIFTVGGSLSVNVHGRDIRYGSLIDTVDSFRLLKADGEVINVSRTENSGYFSYVIGGYGLFGVILDVTLQLAEDELYQYRTASMDYQEYETYFAEKVKKDKKVKMHLARLSVAPGTFLKEIYITDYVLAREQGRLKKYSILKEEELVALPKLMLGMSRYSEWGKNVFWDTQKKFFMESNGKYETRNNVMRSDSEFMEYENPNRTEVLQEYFVPVDEFTSYIDDLRKVLAREELNVLNITIRYVEHDEDAVLSYAKDDMFALVLLINQGRSKQDIQKTEKVIRKTIDMTLKHGGSYYLPYYSYPSDQQLKNAYPRIEEFFKKKRELDPENRFKNLFYERYGK
ncbi:FAD-binding oxidoreductase [Fictibacillus barbaricus]|uniref:FAD-binding oxidoreductase n=1 Tax=Fictibacillus barbaricus TaxID=182136 RepID=A0ABS2Z987_9BACL|nr:FAD-binding oxidoreductase [Fictibacillus barbaricus]MBN3544733.1 FAD-binding oxidoreductase [Fictibacillus barbaricus]GGB64415.1 L-gulonolactone oxidase [Fictibacillus barbaricus]